MWGIPVFFQSELGKALNGEKTVRFSRYTSSRQTKTGLSISPESRFVIESLVEAGGVEPPSEQFPKQATTCVVDLYFLADGSPNDRLPDRQSDQSHSDSRSDGATRSQPVNLSPLPTYRPAGSNVTAI